MLAETTQRTSQKKHLKTSREVYQRLEENISGCQFLMLGLCVIFLGAGTGKYSWDIWRRLLKSKISGYKQQKKKDDEQSRNEGFPPIRLRENLYHWTGQQER